MLSNKAFGALVNSIKATIKDLEPSIFLLRHGHIDASDGPIFVGQTDLPLSRLGRRQAEYWRNIFEGVIFESIVSSDLSRARDTAMIIADGKKQDTRILPELREICLGQWEMISVSKIKEQYPDEFEERGKNLFSFRPPEGENFADLQNRVLKVFMPILENHHHHVLIIGHSGVNRVIMSYLLDIPMQNIFHIAQDYGGLSIIKGNSERYCVQALNLTIDLLNSGQ